MKRLPEEVAKQRAKLILENFLTAREGDKPTTYLTIKIPKNRKKVQSPDSFFIAKWNFNEIK